MSTSSKYWSECKIHLERTLDEAYYPGLTVDELKARNADQIVSGRFWHDKNWQKQVPLLTVPQLWLWKFGEVIVSAHGMTRGFKSVHDMTKGSSCFELHTGHDHRGPLKAWKPILDGTQHPDVRIGLLLASYIEAFGEETLEDAMEKSPGSATNIPPALDLFESAVVSVLSDVKHYVKNTKRNAIDYDTEERLTHVLSDCRSELAMIKHILGQQKQVLDALLDNRKEIWDEDEEDARMRGRPPRSRDPCWKTVENALGTLRRYYGRINKIDGDAERIEKNVQDMLNLKRTYASVQDSHASVLLSTAAIGFAIVTIIFAPLAFLTALFALDITGFDNLRVKDPGGEDKPDVNVVIGGSGSPGDNDFAVNVGVSSNDPVYDRGKMAGIFGKLFYSYCEKIMTDMCTVSTEVLTIVITGLLVWASLRWVGIELGDMRMGRTEKPRDGKGTKDEKKPGNTWSLLSWFDKDSRDKLATPKKKPHNKKGKVSEKEKPKPKAVEAQTVKRRNPPIDLEAQREEPSTRKEKDDEGTMPVMSIG
jgi:hypothetical protein